MGDFAAYLTTQRGLAPKTVRAYVRIVAELADTPLEPAAIEAWSTSRGGAASTVGVRLAAVKAWARFQHVPDPTAELERPKRHKGLPRPVGDWRALMVGEDPRLFAVTVFLAETGLRISEACSVSVPVLGLPDELRVTGKGDKTRMVPLTSAAQRALLFLEGQMPWGPRAVQRRFQDLGRRKGVKITPHMLRHQFGTDLAESGADVGDIQKLMGHASPATTMGYSDWTVERQRAALERRVAWQRERSGAA